MVAVLAPLIAFSQVRAHWGTNAADDQQMFAYYGWRIANGATVYVDVWDNKPPGIYWLNAAGYWLGGGAHLGVAILCVAGLALTYAAFFNAATQLYTRGVAALTTILAGCFLLHPYHEGGTCRTETFVVLFEVLAVAVYLRGVRRHAWHNWLFAGALCGGAVLFKQIGVAAWGAMATHTLALALTRHISWVTALRRGALLAGGLGLVGAATAIVLASQGALAEAWGAVVTFNRSYFESGASQVGSTYSHVHVIGSYVLGVCTLPVLLAAIGLIVSIAGRVTARAHKTPVTSGVPLVNTLLLVWLAVGFYGTLVSPGFVEYYVPPILPPLLLIGGRTLAALAAGQSLVRRARRHAWVAAVLVVVAWGLVSPITLTARGASKVWNEREPCWRAGQWLPELRATPVEELADAIAEMTTPDDRIQGLGYLPGVYLRAGRLATSRFTTTEKLGQVGRSAEWLRKELWTTLREQPPKVLFAAGDDVSMLAPPTDEDAESPRRWLDTHYEFVFERSSIHVYRRK